MAKKKAEESVAVDFGDVESRGGKKGGPGRKHYPAGDYAAKCVSAKLGRSGDKETPRIELTYKFTRGKLKGKEIRDDLYLTEKALWRLRQTLEAMGVKVPSKRVNVKPSSMVGKEVAISIDDDEYDDKIYSRVIDTFTVSELDDDLDEEDDEDDEDETEDEEDEEEEDENEEEEDEEESDDGDLEDLDLDDL